METLNAGTQNDAVPAPRTQITFTRGFGLKLSSGAFGYFGVSCSQNGCEKNGRFWCYGPWGEHQVWISDGEGTPGSTAVGYLAPIGCGAAAHEQAIADITFAGEGHTFRVDENHSSPGWTECAAAHDEEFCLYRASICDGDLVGLTPQQEIVLQVSAGESDRGIAAVFVASPRPRWEGWLAKSYYPMAAIGGVMAGFFTGQIVGRLVSALDQIIG